MMNWNQLLRESLTADVLEEYCRTHENQNAASPPVLTRAGGWTICLQIQDWNIETLAPQKLARLRNRKTGAAVYQTELELYRQIKLILSGQVESCVRHPNEIALVLAGGGARGAYEIGVWKALRELGLDELITGIAGTSIGALNALLFALGDYEKAESLWLTLSDEDFRERNKAEIERRTRAYSRRRRQDPLVSFRQFRESVFVTQPELEHAAVSLITGRGDELHRKYRIFTTATWVPQTMEARLFQKDWLDAPLSELEYTGAKLTYFDWNQLCAADIVKVILASSALPVWYDPVVFRGETYFDGGLLDNVPVQPLCRIGYRRFIVVYLKQRDHSERSIIQRKLLNYQDCRAMHIVPRDSFQDHILTTIDLTPEITAQRIQIGYEDALSQIPRQIEKFVKG